jgi:acyl carrier protein
MAYHDSRLAVPRRKGMSEIDVKTMVMVGLRDLLCELAAKAGSQIPAVDESTRLIGKKGILDSLGLVTLIVSIEQKLLDEHGIEVTIADERALSMEKSPFLTVSSLSDYITLLIKEQG